MALALALALALGHQAPRCGVVAETNRKYVSMMEGSQQATARRHYGKGIDAFNAARWEEAVQHFAAAAAQDSFYRAGALFNVALLKDVGGEEEEARNIFQQAITAGSEPTRGGPAQYVGGGVEFAVYPMGGPSRARLGLLHARAGDFEGALALFDGPLARQTATTSAFGAWLDADVLDPLGSWTVLAAAHASLPEYRAVWALILLRSIPPFGTELKLGEDGETALSAVVPYIPTTHVVWAVACAGTVLRWARVRRAVGERAARIAARIAVAAAALAAAAHPL